MPVVETGNIAAPPLDMAASFSNFAASRAMVLHLAARGYRRIGFVSLPSHGNDRVQERRRGYEAALDELGMALVPDHAIEVPPGLAAGAEALVRLKTGCPEIDAIFFSGDVLGIGAALECQRRGWRVPGEVAIACADDLEMLAQMSPSLTTLRIPRYEIGKQAAGLLIDRIQRGGAEGEDRRSGFRNHSTRKHLTGGTTMVQASNDSERVALRFFEVLNTGNLELIRTQFLRRRPGPPW